MKRTRFHAVRLWILIFAFATVAPALDLKIVDGRNKPRDIESMVTDISEAHAVFIGENHDRFDQHLSELEIIRRLNARDPKRWAIGVEFIQRPFQKDLDAYIAGDIGEREFLRKSEYFDRWGFDFRLYSPIFRFAREHAIPMVALNADRELTGKVGKVGLDGLAKNDRESLPSQIDKSDNSYRKRIQKIFKEHSQAKGKKFEHFWEAQLVWDETMAEGVAAYLSSHPGKAMIVLAGAGHIEFGSGIPNRVRRRLPQSETAILITDDKPKSNAKVADYFLISKQEVLPPAPKMGIVMEVSEGVYVKSLTAGGPATESGIKPKDRLVAIDHEAIESLGDVRLALLERKSGDAVLLQIRRNSSAGTEDLIFEIVLQ